MDYERCVRTLSLLAVATSKKLPKLASDSFLVCLGLLKYFMKHRDVLEPDVTKPYLKVRFVFLFVNQCNTLIEFMPTTSLYIYAVQKQPAKLLQLHKAIQ